MKPKLTAFQINKINRLRFIIGIIVTIGITGCVSPRPVKYWVYARLSNGYYVPKELIVEVEKGQEFEVYVDSSIHQVQALHPIAK